MYVLKKMYAVLWLIYFKTRFGFFKPYHKEAALIIRHLDKHGRTNRKTVYLLTYLGWLAMKEKDYKALLYLGESIKRLSLLTAINDPRLFVCICEASTLEFDWSMFDLYSKRVDVANNFPASLVLGYCKTIKEITEKEECVAPPRRAPPGLFCFLELCHLVGAYIDCAGEKHESVKTSLASACLYSQRKSKLMKNLIELFSLSQVNKVVCEDFVYSLSGRKI